MLTIGWTGCDYEVGLPFDISTWSFHRLVQAGASQQQLALMNQRKVLTGENRGTRWVDTTADSIERIKARLGIKLALNSKRIGHGLET
jgi:hypothetical protein